MKSESVFHHVDTQVAKVKTHSSNSGAHQKVPAGWWGAESGSRGAWEVGFGLKKSLWTG